MLARLATLLGRLTRAEQVLLAWLLLAPVTVAVAAILVSLELEVAALVVILAWYVVAVAGVGGSLGRRLLARRRLARSAGPIIAEAPQLDTRGLLAARPEAWASIESDALEHLRVVRSFARLSPEALLSFATRTRSRWVREIYAYRLTGGRYGYGMLRTLLDAANQSSDLMLGALDLNLVASLARVLASQNTRPGDARTCRAMLAYAAHRYTPGSLTAANQSFLAERLVLDGQSGIAVPLMPKLELTPFTRRLLLADLVNPFEGLTDGRSREVWLGEFNGVFEPYGLEPVTIAEGAPTPYDGLGTEPIDPVQSGPLVSIIMSCYRPDHALSSAIRSVIDQTWQNWELLLIDDGSPAEFRDVILGAAALDPRIRPLFSEANAGTYVRRNDALAEARGEFVTMHDSDDWAHPRRIEIQVRHLLEHPELVANLANSLRVSESLMFAQPRGARGRAAESSILFRREQVRARMGWFDSVRKGADTEFRLRLEAAFGRDIPIVNTVAPLILVRYAASSLSAPDLADGWMNPGRVAYRSAHDLWHADIRSGASAMLDYPLRARPFPAPGYITGTGPDSRDLDIVVGLDARTDAMTPDNVTEVVAELEHLASDGMRVGIMLFETLRERPPSRVFAILEPDIQRLVNSGRVCRVMATDEVTTRSLIVRHACAAQGAPDDPVAVRAERIVVVEDRLSGADARGQNFARADVEQTVASMFGRPPEWYVRDAGSEVIPWLNA